MSKIHDLLDEVRAKVAPSDTTLREAREHRDLVLASAASFVGAQRTYRSGSIAHGNANDDTDADGGVVLDRRVWTELGPDGDGEGPGEVVEQVRRKVRSNLNDDGWDVSTRLTKRAIAVRFPDGPSVDLIVGLTRKDAKGIWIPNLKARRWDPSHPERHTELLTDDPKSLRVTRARAIRLTKAWNKQPSKPGLCSFNIEALALAAVESGKGLPEALHAIADHGATDLAKRLTPDPACVSPPIKLLIDRDLVVSRLTALASSLAKALDTDDDDEVQDQLAAAFPQYIDPADGRSQASIAASLRSGNDRVRYTPAGLSAVAGSHLKTTRSFGG
jgi:hypothetical protein